GRTALRTSRALDSCTAGHPPAYNGKGLSSRPQSQRLNPMFQSSDRFPFVRALEENWKDILSEYQAVARDPDMHAWPEGQLYDGRWDTYGLYAFGKKQHKNCERCPATTRLVEAIPGMVMAGFSRLGPGTHIKPHVGYGGWAQYVLRCHLGLI